jgi:tripartite-type tricarboxylate transporter receptor subunit TctC
VSSAQRSPALPDVPTTNEAGVANSDYTLWVGMIVPAATPAAVVKRLHDEAVKAVGSPEVKARLASLGADPMPMEPPAFNAYIKTEMEAAALIARSANLKAQ